MWGSDSIIWMYIEVHNLYLTKFLILTKCLTKFLILIEEHLVKIGNRQLHTFKIYCIISILIDRTKIISQISQN